MADNSTPKRSKRSKTNEPVDMEALRSAFYQAFGEAMSAFGGIEVGLMSTFRALLRPQNPKCADDLFTSMTGFKVRVDMVTTLMKSAQLSDQVREAWNGAATRIAAAQKKRNAIAHMHVREMTGKDMFGHDPSTDFASLPLPWGARMNHVQTTQKLKGYAKEFNEVARLIFEFNKRIETSMRAPRVPA